LRAEGGIQDFLRALYLEKESARNTTRAGKRNNGESAISENLSVLTMRDQASSLYFRVEALKSEV
jgi:hypothetical protein